jgi:hypothetical protein
MHWLMLNLPLMAIITGVVVGILSVGMYLQYSDQEAKREATQESEGIYLPHVAQGIRTEEAQRSVRTVVPTTATTEPTNERVLVGASR